MSSFTMLLMKVAVTVDFKNIILILNLLVFEIIFLV
jgi:hypothetical protein